MNSRMRIIPAVATPVVGIITKCMINIFLKIRRRRISCFSSVYSFTLVPLLSVVAIHCLHQSITVQLRVAYIIMSTKQKRRHRFEKYL